MMNGLLSDRFSAAQSDSSSTTARHLLASASGSPRSLATRRNAIALYFNNAGPKVSGIKTMTMRKATAFHKAVM